MDKRFYKTAVMVLSVAYIAISIFILIDDKYLKSLPLFLLRLFIQLFFIWDYLYRFIKAKGKWLFVRSSILDFIATVSIQPSLSFFRLFTLLRVSGIDSKLKNLKLVQKAIELSEKPRHFINRNGLIHILYINLIAITIGSLAVYYFEKGAAFPSYGDAVWWAFVTVTTVGYGDFVPHTFMGRVVAVVLMVIGIALISMLTGSIASNFTQAKDERSNSIAKLKSIVDKMDSNEIDKLSEYAETMKKGSNEPH